MDSLHESFKVHVDALPSLIERLLASEPFPASRIPPSENMQGVYLFSEGGRPFYVGRTGRMRDRLQEHGRPSSSHAAAPFAFRLAREATGRMQPSYAKVGGRVDLCADPVFAEAFRQAKERVRAMDVRWIAEADPVRQALLEIYAATVLGTPYNSFGNH
jgi:hypothetical protein